MRQAGETTTAWSDGTIALSLERSVTQVSLSVKEPAPAQFRELIAQQRNLADERFESALVRIRAMPSGPARDGFLAEAEDTRTRIGALRGEVDKMLSAPKSERPTTRMKNLPFEMKNVIARMKKAVICIFQKQKRTQHSEEVHLRYQY